MRNLASGVVFSLDFPATTEVVLNSLQNVQVCACVQMLNMKKLKEGQYGRPIQDNFESVDSFMLTQSFGKVLFQMTVLLVYPVKSHGVTQVSFFISQLKQKVLDALPPCGKGAYLVFVVPPGVSEQFKVQEFHTTSKTVAKTPPAVEQMVLTLDFNF